MNTITKIVSVAVLLIATSNTAQAFDGDRKGFQIGLGLGAHTTAMNFSQTNQPGEADSEQRVAVAAQIGYGFTNRFTAYIGGRTGVASFGGVDGMLSFAGFGGTFYLSESSPSLYVTGLIGSGSLSTNAAENEDRDLRDSGSAWLAGVGYEVTRRLHLELSYGRAELVDPNNDQNTSDLESAFLTAQYIWY